MLEDVSRRKLSLPSGLEISLLDWGGEGPPLLLHHATGFCAGVWDEVARRLSARFHVIAMDARGHGDSSKPAAPEAYAWDHFGEDLRAVAQMLAREAGSAALPLGVGHSFGGTAMLLASRVSPSPFERLVLVDPVIPPPPGSGLQLARGPRANHMVEGARKRRAHWESRAEARAWFEERSLFENWLPGALDAYVAEGLCEDAERGVRLKCPPDVEAAVFGASFDSDAWGAASRVGVPTRVVRALHGDFPSEVFQALVERMSDARLEEVEAGHLVPMERPELVVEAILRSYAEPGSTG